MPNSEELPAATRARPTCPTSGLVPYRQVPCAARDSNSTAVLGRETTLKTNKRGEGVERLSFQFFKKSKRETLTYAGMYYYNNIFGD